jgi:hypothetical protein
MTLIHAQPLPRLRAAGRSSTSTLQRLWNLARPAIVDGTDARIRNRDGFA